jgi:pimeloyl-ACP methyl ester carboxylesterase
MDIVLLGGLWLPVREWDRVVAALAEEGHRGLPVLLPGQGDGNRAATLDDQVTAVLVTIDECEGTPLVVGHSASSALAWIAADARPDKVGGVVLIGGFPVADGAMYAGSFPVVDGVMPFPGWELFDAPVIADLDEATRERLASEMIPVPERVTRAAVQLTDERRYEVPVTLFCPEFSPNDVKDWIVSGEVPELPLVKHLDLVDIDSGHWPMVTQPGALARLLEAVAQPLAEAREVGASVRLREVAANADHP